MKDLPVLISEIGSFSIVSSSDICTGINKLFMVLNDDSCFLETTVYIKVWLDQSNNKIFCRQNILNAFILKLRYALER